jgi:hypothetical protein
LIACRKCVIYALFLIFTANNCFFIVHTLILSHMDISDVMNSGLKNVSVLAGECLMICVKTRFCLCFSCFTNMIYMILKNQRRGSNGNQ